MNENEKNEHQSYPGQIMPRVSKKYKISFNKDSETFECLRFAKCIESCMFLNYFEKDLYKLKMRVCLSTLPDYWSVKHFNTKD